MGPVSWEWESLQELHGGDALRASNEEQSRLPGGRRPFQFPGSAMPLNGWRSRVSPTGRCGVRTYYSRSAVFLPLWRGFAA